MYWLYTVRMGQYLKKLLDPRPVGPKKGSLCVCVCVCVGWGCLCGSGGGGGGGGGGVWHKKIYKVNGGPSRLFENDKWATISHHPYNPYSWVKNGGSVTVFGTIWFLCWFALRKYVLKKYSSYVPPQNVGKPKFWPPFLWVNIQKSPIFGLFWPISAPSVLTYYGSLISCKTSEKSLELIEKSSKVTDGLTDKHDFIELRSGPKFDTLL